MKIYTLLFIISEDKVVHMKTFNTMDQLKDYKNYSFERLKNAELVPIDKDGYVWFCEALSEENFLERD